MSNELKLFIDNDKDWKNKFDAKQELIFKEIKEIRQDFSKKQIHCENRFTKLEIKSGLWGVIGGILAACGINLWK